MNYVTTNIRIPEDDYLRLKQEAAVLRKSLSHVVRMRLKNTAPKKLDGAEKLLAETDAFAKRVRKKLVTIDSVSTIRRLRDTRYGKNYHS
ncbi:hypothetical protein HY947_00835 [Candidatus Gottesmanbacteria bacterium]|nr:hypothetical protein [Candidatus Gottesmanbacteria bacterium]